MMASCQIAKELQSFRSLASNIISVTLDQILLRRVSNRVHPTQDIVKHWNFAVRFYILAPLRIPLSLTLARKITDLIRHSTASTICWVDSIYTASKKKESSSLRSTALVFCQYQDCKTFWKRTFRNRNKHQNVGSHLSWQMSYLHLIAFKLNESGNSFVSLICFDL